MVDQTISHYRVTEKLGEGGMGVVYKAEDLKLGRAVALKFLPSHLLDSEEHKKRFLHEARAAASLDHPNICTVYEIDEANGQTFLAMACLEGQTLKQKIAERPLPLRDAIHIALQIGQGLQAAHENGIVHRDIKPANIMVTLQGQVRIMDFGLAQLNDSTKVTATGTKVGTPAYMSPEQVEGKPTDRRTDIWALGVVLYEMVSGRVPFAREVEAAVAYAILHTEPEPPTALRSGVPVELDRVIRKALAKNPQKRYQHIDELATDLGLLKRQEQRGTNERVPAQTPTSSRKAWYAGAAAASALILAGVGAYLLSHGPPPAETPLQVRPLTSYPGSERSPSFSPDGNQVAFSWNGENQDNYDIYVTVVGSGTPLRLTTNQAGDFTPVWSPDGRQIAFIRDGEETSSIFLIPPIGGRERKITELSGLDQASLTWSADAKSLLVSLRKSPTAPRCIYSVDIETGNQQQLTSPPPGELGDAEPAVSPDGQRLAFRRSNDSGTGSDIFLTRLSDSQPIQLTSVGPVFRPAWAPDSRKIIFSRSSWSSGVTLWMVPVSGGEPRQLALAGQQGAFPAVARQGGRLAYETQQSGESIWRYELELTGSEPRPPQPILASTRIDRAMDLSPDGTQVVFVSARSGQSEIWGCDVSGSNPVQLTSLRASGSPRWSPDGRRIAFDSAGKKGKYDIYLVDPDGGSLRSVTVEESEESRPSWSRDGAWIYFNSDRSGAYEIWKTPVEGGAAVQVTRKGGFNARESPDGQFLYYGKRFEAGIWKSPLNGGEETQVLSRPELGFLGGWVVFDDGIYFIDMQTDASGEIKWYLQFFRFINGETTLLVDVGRQAPAGSNFLDISPDRTWFLYARTDQNDSDLMLVENFH